MFERAEDFGMTSSDRFGEILDVDDYMIYIPTVPDCFEYKSSSVSDAPTCVSAIPQYSVPLVIPSSSYDYIVFQETSNSVTLRKDQRSGVEVATLINNPHSAEFEKRIN